MTSSADGRPIALFLSQVLHSGTRLCATRPMGGVCLMGMACLLASAALATTAMAAPIQNPMNGHFYEAVSVAQGITWPSARSRASDRIHEGMPGHLATITSDEENQFIATHFRVATQNGYWLGGFQIPGILDPAAGWQWVTGEPFGYTRWLDFDFLVPDDAVGPGTGSQDENALHFWPPAGGRWNDVRPSLRFGGYVVEYEPAPPPEVPTITGYATAEARGVAATSAAPGALLVITGTHLGRGGTVLFEGIPLPAAVVNWSPTEILLFVPTAPSYPFRGRAIVVVDGKQADGAELTIAAPTPEKDNLLANGSFEYPDSSSSPVDWGYTYGLPLDPDPTFFRGAVIPGWRISQGTIDVKRYYWVHAPEQGRQSIDLVGSPGAALLEQTFYTQPGRQYIFSGWVAHNPGVPEGQADLYLNQEFKRSLRHTRASTFARMNWTAFTYRFRAEQAQTTLSLLDVTRYALVAGAALDGLSVTLAPE